MRSLESPLEMPRCHLPSSSYYYRVPHIPENTNLHNSEHSYTHNPGSRLPTQFSRSHTNIHSVTFKQSSALTQKPPQCWQTETHPSDKFSSEHNTRLRTHTHMCTAPRSWRRSAGLLADAGRGRREVGRELRGLPAAARREQEAVVGAAEQLVLRSENSSPGNSWRLHTEQRKHSMWYTLSRARIARSLLLKPTWHGALDAEEPAGPRHGRCQHRACGRPATRCYPPRAHAPRRLCGREGGCGDQPSAVPRPGDEWRRAFEAGACRRPAIHEPRPQRAVAQRTLAGLT